MKTIDVLGKTLDGPFTFKYRKNSVRHRVCYIINGYHSGLYNVYCPSYTEGGETFSAEFDLAREVDTLEDGHYFIAFGKDHYCN